MTNIYKHQSTTSHQHYPRNNALSCQKSNQKPVSGAYDFEVDNPVRARSVQTLKLSGSKEVLQLLNQNCSASFAANREEILSPTNEQEASPPKS